MNKLNTIQRYKLHKISPYKAKRICSIILTGALLFLSCPKVSAGTIDSYEIACVMQEEYSNSVIPTIKSKPSTATPSEEPKICTEFDWVDVKVSDYTIAISIVDGEEKHPLVRKYFDKKDNMLLVDAFSDNKIYIEEYNNEVIFIPIGIMEEKKVEAIERIDLEQYLIKIGMSETDAKTELYKIKTQEDLRKLYERRVPKEKQVILPLFIPEGEYMKNENEEEYVQNKQKVKGLLV